MLYTLNFTIDPDGVRAINGPVPGSGQLITIAKSVAGGGTTPVAWLTFEAAQTIQVSWEENYWLYAANQQIQAGATITETAITTSAALTGVTYPFETDNLFGPSAPPGPPGSFQVDNQVGNNSWLFGLAQMATVAGKKTTTAVPINVVSVLNNETVTFTPEVTVSIFLQSFSNNGVVISSIESNALTLTLTSAAPAASIGFNDALNQFTNTTVAMAVASAKARARLTQRA